MLARGGSWETEEKRQERGESCWTPESPVSTEGGKLLRRTLQRPNDSMVELMNDRETII